MSGIVEGNVPMKYCIINSLISSLLFVQSTIKKLLNMHV